MNKLGNLIKKFKKSITASGLVITMMAYIGLNESSRNTAYQDSGGVWTICYGETQNVHKGDYKTDDECIQSLYKDVIKHNSSMKKYVYVPLTEYQEIAFTDFVYNIGEGNWKSSTALKLLNQKQYEEACAQMFRWVYTNKKFIKGLQNRREKEYKTCMGNDADIEWALSYARNEGYILVGEDNEQDGIAAYNKNK